MKKAKFIILLLIIVLLFIMVISFYKRDTLMWHYKSTILHNIKPAVRGDMLVNDNEVLYIFDPYAQAMIEFAPYNPPPLEELDSFIPPVKEEWMNSSEERLNRSTVRLFRTGLNSDPSILFREYGRKGYWWTNEDIKTIYILVEWFDYTKSNEPAYLTFWKSTNGGTDFTKVKWTNPQWGRGKSIGMYFDSKGINGYIFVNQNTLLQTQDAGETWQKVYIPHTDSKPLPYLEIAIDAVTVDSQGNLLFALFEEGNTSIYQVPYNNKEQDLSQIEAKYKISNKRLLNISSVPDKNGMYLFYINCKDGQCTWFDSSKEEQGKKNQSLYFAYFDSGKYLVDQSLGFFLSIKKVYLGEQGKIVVTLEMPNKSNYNLLLSSDYGKNWILEDLTDTRVVSDYVDLKNNRYWQNRIFNKVYMADELF